MTLSTRSITARQPARRFGFSIVELLVVIAIIIALLGALLAALSLASRRAQSAQSQQFLTSISQALTAFQTDVGYLPPLLGRASGQTVANSRDYFGQPNWVLNASGVPNQTSINDLQLWYSFTTLPEYLLGYGDRTQDGHGAYQGNPTPAGSQGSKEALLGIRHPGDDGYWNGIFNPRPAGTPGTLASRNPLDTTVPYNASTANNAVAQGKVFGPYLQLADSTNLGGITGFQANGDPIIVTAGDPSFAAAPKVFIDYWGSPISYYRRPYVSPDLKTYERFSSTQTPRDLGDIFALRPAEYKPGEDLVGVADANNDNTTLGRLKSANFALLSRGPDKSWDRSVRRDENGFNRDNIVEAGQ